MQGTVERRKGENDVASLRLHREVSTLSPCSTVYPHSPRIPVPCHTDKARERYAMGTLTGCVL